MYNSLRPAGYEFPASILLDPDILRSARQLYKIYYEIHPQKRQRPTGVVVDRYSHRGKLIFRPRPILLYTECFVPFSQIEASIY